MPYTPPALASPSTSHQSSPPRSPGPRPNLPRSNSSTSYLSRHRRSPSWQGQETSRSGHSSNFSESNSRSLRQSPPPLTDSAIPAGAILSPPDSTQNSSDDDEPAPKNTREVEGLHELEEAVRSLDMNRTSGSPPNGQSGPSNKRGLHLEMPRNDMDSESRVEPLPSAPPRLSASARRISHSRSATESSILDVRNTQSANASLAGSDESDDDADGAQDKPPLLRKKSGELVKPAIRPSSRRRHSSMPGTPTYSKAVHFNDNIEQVRHFLQVDRPIAVSAGTSPVDGYEEETEFPFGYRGPAGVEWDMRLANFPRDSFERLSSPIRVERIFLSSDKKSLIGIASVANIAFHKQVVARFTLDYWQTTSEVTAEYNNDLRQRSMQDGYDQFNFTIKLADQANLESKTMFICVRYNVNGQEFWDNNNSVNYQVDFVKKQAQPEAKPPPQPQAARPPRSRHNSSSARPRSVPSFEDDFASSFDPSSVIRFRNGVSGSTKLADTAPQRRQAPSGQQFGSRYDFGASLSAALSQAQAQLGEQSSASGNGSNGDSIAGRSQTKPRQLPQAGQVSLQRQGNIPPPNSGTESPRPDTLLANKQSLDSRAYQDFVSKFCFFGSSKSAVQGSSPKSRPPGSTDGAQDDSDTDHTFGAHEEQGADSKEKQKFNNLPPGTERFSPCGSGSASPMQDSGTGLEPRPASPISFGFPFTPELRPGVFTPEAQANPTAIQG